MQHAGMTPAELAELLKHLAPPEGETFTSPQEAQALIRTVLAPKADEREEHARHLAELAQGLADWTPLEPSEDITKPRECVRAALIQDGAEYADRALITRRRIAVIEEWIRRWDEIAPATHKDVIEALRRRKAERL